MRVLVYGGRDFKETNEARAFFWDTLLFYDLVGTSWSTIISGGARGADKFGEMLGAMHGLKVEVYPADWDKYKKAAGHIRNQQMLDSGVDLAVQFPGGKGTADMRRRLDKAGVKVHEFHEQAG